MKRKSYSNNYPIDRRFASLVVMVTIMVVIALLLMTSSKTVGSGGTTPTASSGPAWEVGKGDGGDDSGLGEEIYGEGEKLTEAAVGDDSVGDSGGDDDTNSEERPIRKCGVNRECPPEEEIPPIVPENEEVEQQEPNVSISICNESWNCTKWTDCIKGVMTRHCVDVNGCNTSNRKPFESQDCVPITEQIIVNPVSGKEMVLPLTVILILVAIPLILVILMATGIVSLRRKKRFVVSTGFVSTLEEWDTVNELEKIEWEKYGEIYTTRYVPEGYIKVRGLEKDEKDEVAKMMDDLMINESDAEAIVVAKRLNATILTNNHVYAGLVKKVGVESRVVLNPDDIILSLDKKSIDKLKTSSLK